MRIPRLFLDIPISTSAAIELPEPARHYMSNVLRLGIGDNLIVFNGDGIDYSASIKELKPGDAWIVIESSRKTDRESSLRIELGQGISRGERMDLVLQKAVELGVHGLTPLWTARCQVQLKGSRLEKRLSHWRGIIHSACEQSGRAVIPSLHQPATLDDWIGNHEAATSILMDPSAPTSLLDLPRTDHVRLLIGPEGGLTFDEVRAAEARGFVPIRLGPRVLRTETAALAGLAALQTIWGDLGR